jgi:hypothetical protein
MEKPWGIDPDTVAELAHLAAEKRMIAADLARLSRDPSWFSRSAPLVGSLVKGPDLAFATRLVLVVS